MDKKIRAWFGVIVIALVITWGMLGAMVWKQNQPQGPSMLAAGFNPIYFDWASKKLIVESGGEIEVQSGGVVDMQSGSVATFAGTQTFDDSITSGAAIANTGTFTTSLTLGDTFTALRFGTIANATDGMTITHGLGAAPKFVMLTPYGDGITVSVGVAVSDTTSFTVDTQDGVTVGRVMWLAGK